MGGNKEILEIFGGSLCFQKELRGEKSWPTEYNKVVLKKLDSHLTSDGGKQGNSGDFWGITLFSGGTVREKEKSQTNTKVFFLASCIYKCKYILSNFYSSVALTQQTRKTRF